MKRSGRRRRKSRGWGGGGGEGAGKEEEERNEHWPLCMTLRYDVDKDKLFLCVSSCWVPLLKVPALITR